MKKKIGVLLINLGTPEAATPFAVCRYLREFLSDPAVINVPWVLRMVILYGLILPFRTLKTTRAYQKIWTASGSPLFVNSVAFMTRLQATLGDTYHVALGMRYQQPSLKKALTEFKKTACEKIIALPLFPQFANATNGSAIKKLKKLSRNNTIPCEIIPAFYDQPGYYKTIASIINETDKINEIEFFLFSYHGLPERQLTHTSHQNCYRSQCFKTTHAITKTLGLDTDRYATTFQSRLGNTVWIKPYTDVILPALRARGITRLLITCPSFVVDCLETLEEISIRLHETWLALGGKRMVVAPCLNDDPRWVQAVAEMIR